MPAQPASFIWYDLMTSDTKAAESFYTKVIGWKTTDFGGSGQPYTVLSAGETGIGGLMAIPDEACAQGVRPCWTGYIRVDDVDASAARLTAAGGKIHRPPEDIPTVGRFAVVADPDGAMFNLFTPMGGPAPAPVAQGTPGHVGWNELQASDGERAFAFYSGQFGWTKAEAMDMGPMGVYLIFAAGGAPIGGMMTKLPETPAPFWLYYFNVDAIDAAVGRVKEGGGTVMMEPLQVPTGSWIVTCLDPQGAMFAMVSATR